MPHCVPSWIYPVWDSLCFLYLGDYLLFQIRAVFDYSLFKCILNPFLFFLFWEPYNSKLVHLMLPQRSLRLSLFLFILFSVFCSMAKIPPFFQVTYPFFCLSYSSIDSFQCTFHFSYGIVHLFVCSLVFLVCSLGNRLVISHSLRPHGL